MNLSQTQNPLKMKNRTTFYYSTSRASGISIITPVFYLTILKSSASSDSLNLPKCRFASYYSSLLCINESSIISIKILKNVAKRYIRYPKESSKQLPKKIPTI